MLFASRISVVVNTTDVNTTAPDRVAWKTTVLITKEGATVSVALREPREQILRRAGVVAKGVAQITGAATSRRDNPSPRRTPCQMPE
jgi:hypothetical protein